MLRTVRFYGIGIGTTPAEIRVIVKPPHAGYQVFYTEVPTIVSLLDLTEYQILFTIQVPVDFSGQVPMSVHCTKGTAVVLSKMNANYCYEDSLNPKYSDDDRLILDNPNSSAADRARIWRSRSDPPFGAQENAIIEKYINEPTKETYQEAKLFFSKHGLASVSSGPNGFKNSCFEGSARINCCLDDVPIEDNREAIEKTMTWPGKVGTFKRTIPVHSTLTFDLNILAGML